MEIILRLLFATFIIFGMRVDCPGVWQIIHMGVPDDTGAYIQEQVEQEEMGKLHFLYY